METTMSAIEPVTFEDVLSLASWERPRTTVELRSFVNSRDDLLDVEDFDL